VLGDRLVEGAPGSAGGAAWKTLPPDDAAGRWIVVLPPSPWRGFAPGPSGPPGSDAPVPATDAVASARLRDAFPPDLPASVRLGPPATLDAVPEASVLLRAIDGRSLVLEDGDAVAVAFDPADPRGTFHRSGAHAVFWRALLDAGPAVASAGVLDAAESDLRGEERPLDPAFGADVEATEVTSTRSLRAPLAAVGVLAVLLLLLSLRRRA
jgi:hypothetical protein